MIGTMQKNPIVRARKDYARKKPHEGGVFSPVRGDFLADFCGFAAICDPICDLFFYMRGRGGIPATARDGTHCHVTPRGLESRANLKMLERYEQNKIF